jgi:hypothetical protein
VFFGGFWGLVGVVGLAVRPPVWAGLGLKCVVVGRFGRCEGCRCGLGAGSGVPPRFFRLRWPIRWVLI